MSGNNRKLAAVPFINQKGERSMKRVKVERHIAGRKPSYAREEEEDEEYYTTDDEEQEEEEEEQDEEDNRKWPIKGQDRLREEGRDSEKEDGQADSSPPRPTLPREMLYHIKHTHEPPNVIMDDDEDEEDVRRRHVRAQMRKIELPTGRPVQNLGSDDEGDSQEAEAQVKRLDTDDLLKDLQLTGFSRLVREEPKEEDQSKSTSEDEDEDGDEDRARIEEINRKVEQDIKKEAERIALAKSHIVARELASVNTDDEDEEIAQEEWKLREIKRVMRYRAERMLRA